MLRRFWKSEDGNYAVIFSIAVLPMLTGVAGVVDFVGTSNKGAGLQSALDATALAIGTKYYAGMTQADLRALGLKYFENNMQGVMTADTEVDQSAVAASAAEFEASAVQSGEIYFLTVTSNIDHEAFLSWSSAWHTQRSAEVSVENGQPACVLALDPHASSSVKIQGSTIVQLDGCVIAANSNADNAVYRGGTAQVAADCVSTVGHTAGIASNSSVNLTCGKPLERQNASLDPLGTVTPPTGSGCTSMPGGKTKTLSPGTYCNETWSGNITLQPGVYVLKDGQVKLGGGGSLVGIGVTIFLIDGAEFTTNANETIVLSPSTVVPYAGITIFQEKGNTEQLTINGGSGSELSGFIYAPSAEIFYAGNADMSGEGECIRIIGRTIEMTGNSKIRSDCYFGGKVMTAGRYVTLIK